MSASDHQLWSDLQRQRSQLSGFRQALSPSLQDCLDRYEWAVVAGAGQGGMPLLILRLPHRVSLADPILHTLAAQAEALYGPVDFALFSGETSTPLKVFSATLLDRRWRWGSRSNS